MTTPDPTPESIADEYRQTSERFMRQAEAEYERGDLLQASEKAWGGAVQQLKALATLRGLSHTSHWEIRNVARSIAAETGQGSIADSFATGEALHSNFYEQWMSERDVRSGMDDMIEFIEVLQNVPTSNIQIPTRRLRTRPFYRDRGDG